MRILRFILNCMLFVVVAITLTFAQLGIFGLSAAQSKRVDAVQISASESDEVAFFDAFGFWGTDLAEGCKQPSKYRIRNWISWGWWKQGMEWADIALDKSIAAIKPIVVPLAQVNALADYYGMTADDLLLNETKDGVNEDLFGNYSSEEILRQQMYEYFTLYRPDLVSEGIYNVYIKDYSGSLESLNNKAKNDEGKKVPVALPVIENIEEFEGKEVDIKSSEYGRWVKNNSKVYNHIWKITKYNSSAYETYFNKFIEVNEDESRDIKTPVVVLYSMIYISLTLSTVFVIMYPVSLIQARIVGKKRKDTDSVA